MNIFLLLLFLASSAFSADYWRNFGRPYPIRSIMPFNEAVLVATPVGMRLRTERDDVLFSVVDGLGTSSFNTLVTCDAGVFAISEYGLVASWRMEDLKWTLYNRSFEVNGVRAIPDVAVGNKEVLVIAFEDRLAFFDARARRFVLTINKIGENSLMATPVEALGVHDDTLYVSVSDVLYKRVLDWDYLDKDISLIDPDSWIVARRGEYIKKIVWKGDSLKTFPIDGQWEWDEKGRQTSVAPDSSYIYIDGQPLKIPSLYENGVSLVRRIANCREVAYLAGEYFLVAYDKKKKELVHYTEFATFPINGTYEITPMTDGGVIAASPEGQFGFFKNPIWAGPIPVDASRANGGDALTNRLKVLSFLGPDIVFYHIWGSGFYLYSDYGRKLEKATLGGPNNCFSNYEESMQVQSKNNVYDTTYNYFVVSGGTTVAPDSSGFLTTAASTDGFDLVYVTKDGEYSCANHVGSRMFTGPIVASKIENSSDWRVMVSGRESASYGADGGLEVFRIADPGKNGGRLQVLEHKTIASSIADSPVDMAYDAKNRYLWLVTKSQLQYWDIDKDSLNVPYSVKGVVGTEYTSAEFDVQGNLWVGTMGQGAYRLTRKGVSQDSLVAQQFTVKNGMLTNEVLDIAIDPVLGDAWFSHEKGATLYRRNDLRNAADKNSTIAEKKVIAYPNPFRVGEHDHLTIDNIGENAVVSIYNRAGHLIYSFAGNETKGGSADWYGFSRQGYLVAPGVYWYVVKKPSGKSEKGKFIVIH